MGSCSVFQSKAVRCTIAISTVLLCYVVLLVIDAPDYSFSIIGGLVGAVSSLIVIVDCVIQKKDFKTPFPLLFWRAFCDLGLAIRFMAIPGFNLLICGNLVCTRENSNEQMCSLPSAMFEFFSISSEAWFLCNGLDLYYSVTNPFSSLKTRMFMYHVFVWSVALLFSVLPLISRHKDRIFGFWFVNPNSTDSAVCWIKVDRNSLSMPIWVLFFIPLLVIYSVCCVSLVMAYARLRRGISRTFLPRMKLLVTNTANVIVLILYWFVLVFFYSWAFFTRYDTYNHYLSNILMFIFASKGFSSLVVWIFITDAHPSVATLKNSSSVPGGGGEEEDVVDANKALREEVLNFATAGIRSAARGGDKVTKDRREITRLPLAQTVGSSSKSRKQLITPYFFIRFILGQQEEVQAVETMVGNKRRSVNAIFQRQNTETAAMPVAAAEDDVEMSTMRLSQRPTMVASANQQLTDYSPNGAITGTGPLNGLGRAPSFAVRPSTTFEGGEEADKPRPYSSEVSVRPSEMFEASELVGDHSTAKAAPSTPNEGAFGFTSLKEIVSNNIFSRLYASVKSVLLDATEAVEFTEFEPYHFREIRLSVGITDDVYINYFSTTIKERLTQGGASGAFFFFSKGEKFIAKSCTATELESLKGSAERYSDYLTHNKDSFISKIFGAYRLKIYGNSLHFFVMNNIFLNPEGLIMNEKYDIKGSWVARNAETPSNGQSVNCTHCEQKFVYHKKTPRRTKGGGSSSKKSKSGAPHDLSFATSSCSDDPESGFTSNPLKRVSRDDDSNSINSNSTSSSGVPTFEADRGEQQHCPYTVSGHHEPNVILKDNDLKYKLRLPLPTAVHLLKQIQMDADFLYSIGVCDYSLLVGVHNTEYDVLLDDGGSSGAQSDGSMRRALVRKNSASFGGPLDGLRARHNSSTHTPFSSGSGGGDQTASNEELTTTRKLEVFRVVGPDAYFMGIIDYQQKWTLHKKLERFFKVHLKGNDPEGLSAINPDIYRDRFMRRIEDILDFDNLNRAASSSSSSSSSQRSFSRDD